MTTADVTITFHIPDLHSFPGTIPEFVDELKATAAIYGATTHTAPTFRAGQKLTAEDMDALPAGSVLRDKTGVEMTKDTHGHWDGEDVSVADPEAFAEHWAPVLVSAPYPAIPAAPDTQEQTR